MPFDEVPIVAARDYACAGADLKFRLRELLEPKLAEVEATAGGADTAAAEGRAGGVAFDRRLATLPFAARGAARVSRPYRTTLREPEGGSL